jgi:hypothetical protein
MGTNRGEALRRTSPSSVVTGHCAATDDPLAGLSFPVADESDEFNFEENGFGEQETGE